MRHNLPSIESIVEQRMNAGIAESAEVEVYYRGDLVESDYSDETKQRLLAELELSKHETVRQTYFSIVFAPGIPLDVAKQFSAKLTEFVGKEIGYPAHVSDPFGSPDQWLTPVRMNKKAA